METTPRRGIRGAVRALVILILLTSWTAPAGALASAQVVAASPLSLDQEVRQAPVLESLAELRKKGASTNQQIDAIERRLNAIDERFGAISEKMLALEVVSRGNAEDMSRLETTLSGRLQRIESYLRIGFGLVALICLGIIVTLITLTREIARMGPAPSPLRRARHSRARVAAASGPVPTPSDEQIPAG